MPVPVGTVTFFFFFCVFEKSDSSYVCVDINCAPKLEYSMDNFLGKLELLGCRHRLAMELYSAFVEVKAAVTDNAVLANEPDISISSSSLIDAFLS